MSGRRAREARGQYAGCSADFDLCDILMDPPSPPEWLAKWRASRGTPRNPAQRYRCFARFMRRGELRDGNNWCRFIVDTTNPW